MSGTSMMSRRTYGQYHISQYIQSNTTFHLFDIISTICFGPMGHHQICKHGR